MLAKKNFGFRHDIWSLGVLSFYLLGGVLPFEGENEVEISHKIKKEEPDWTLLNGRGVSNKIVKVLKKMLKKNSLDRIPIEKLIKSSIFKQIKEQESQVTQKIFKKK